MSDEYDAYVNFLNSNPENDQLFECLIIAHSLFTKTYNLVFDSKEFTANSPDGIETTFAPANIRSTNAANNNDLDQLATFTIEDLDNILDDELDRLPLGNTENPVATYCIYTKSFDDPADFVVYDVNSVPQKAGAFTLSCGAPKLNVNETGEKFDFDRFPMLRGL